MKLNKISSLIMVLACASAANNLQSGDRVIALIIGGSSEDAQKFEPSRNLSPEYQKEVAKPGRSIRSVTDINSSERTRQNNSSGAYYFDYAVVDPEGNLNAHWQERFENGTVTGEYAHGEDRRRYIFVNYVADSNGYRAKIRKYESLPWIFYEIKAVRIDGKLHFQFMATAGVEANVHKLYTKGKDPKTDEEDDDDNSTIEKDTK